MNTTENNKLIAEFMGAIIREKYGCEEVEVHDVVVTAPVWDGDVRYNQSWDWLMPVVEKIESLGYGVTIGMTDYCVIQNDWKEDLEEICSMTENGKLLCTYNAVVEFIKWHNKNK